MALSCGVIILYYIMQELIKVQKASQDFLQNYWLRQ